MTCTFWFSTAARDLARSNVELLFKSSVRRLLEIVVRRITKWLCLIGGAAVFGGLAANYSLARSPRLVYDNDLYAGIKQLVFSEDARLAAVSSDDGWVRLLESRTFRELRRWKSNATTALAFSRDGRLLAGAGNTLRVWDTHQSEPLLELDVRGHEIRSLQLSLDNEAVYFGSQSICKIMLREPPTKPKCTFADIGPISSLALTSAGDRIYVGGLFGIHYYNGYSLEEEGRIEEAIRPDNQVTGDGNFRGGRVITLRFARGGELLFSASEDGELRVWRTKTHIPVFTRAWNNARLGRTAESQRGRLHRSEIHTLVAANDERIAFVEEGVIYETDFLGRLQRQLPLPTEPTAHRIEMPSDHRIFIWGLENEIVELKGKRIQLGSSKRGMGNWHSVKGNHIVHTGVFGIHVWNLDTGYATKLLESTSLALGASQRAILRNSGHVRVNEPSSMIVFSSRELSDLFKGATIRGNSTARSWLYLRESAELVSISERSKLRAEKFDTGDLTNFDLTAVLAGAAINGVSRATKEGRIFVSTPNDLLEIDLPTKRVVRILNEPCGNRLRPTVSSGEYALRNSITWSTFDAYTGVVWLGCDEHVGDSNRVTSRDVRLIESTRHEFPPIDFLSGDRYAEMRLDGSIAIKRADTGASLVELRIAKEGSWVATDPDGRFDTADLESMPHLHWVMPDDPFTPVPLEVFMKDYYTPRLLARIMAGEKLPPVRPLLTLNRTQPDVMITGVVPDASDPSLVSVTVTASGATKNYLQGDGSGGGKEIARATAAHDLRLFRDGQVVGYADGKLAEFNGNAFSKTFTVRLPQVKAGQDVVFSAYAFNDDRVKSETVRTTFKAPALKNATTTKGTAYVVTIGVNQHENRAWNLSFAANDARAVAARVAGDLRKSGRYSEVVSATLAAEGPAPGSWQASKAAIRAVFARLSGAASGELPEVLRGVAGAEALRRVTPDDTLIIAFSGHGFTDEQGMFYLMPQDTGEGQGKTVTPLLRSRSISSHELSLWLRDVDAGDMTMIVDACQSAASIASEGFKPGPMGSRGLGQLSFDKGMRILAASQSDQYALEDSKLQHGLLTFSLINDGLEAFNADHEPKDKTIYLDEWLKYGVTRVPTLWEEVKSGKVVVANRSADRGGPVVLGAIDAQAAAPAATRQQAQTPALFDFAKNRKPVMLLRAVGEQ